MRFAADDHTSLDKLRMRWDFGGTKSTSSSYVHFRKMGVEIFFTRGERRVVANDETGARVWERAWLRRLVSL